MRRSSRSSSRGPGRQRDAFGHFGHRRGDRGVGFAVELAPDVLDRLLEPQADLGLFDLEPADALAQLGELLLGLGAFGAQAVEAARRPRVPRRTARAGAGGAARRAARPRRDRAARRVGERVDRPAASSRARRAGPGPWPLRRAAPASRRFDLARAGARSTERRSSTAAPRTSKSLAQARGLAPRSRSSSVRCAARGVGARACSASRASARTCD